MKPGPNSSIEALAWIKDADLPRHGGTCWRVFGQDPAGRRLAVGVEAYLDGDEQGTVLCTVIDLTGRKRR